MTLTRNESNSPSTPSEQRPGVVERFTLILDAIAAGPERMYLEEITEITGLPRSTVFRLLAQLIDQAGSSTIHAATSRDHGCSP